MTDTKHAPTPWMVKEGDETVITDANGNLILDTAYSDFHLEYDDKPNAAHIVKCVNMHDELVEALNLTLRGLIDGLDIMNGNETNDFNTNLVISTAPDGTIISKAREALKKAGGEKNV